MTAPVPAEAQDPDAGALLPVLVEIYAAYLASSLVLNTAASQAEMRLEVLKLGGKAFQFVIERSLALMHGRVKGGQKITTEDLVPGRATDRGPVANLFARDGSDPVEALYPAAPTTIQKREYPDGRATDPLGQDAMTQIRQQVLHLTSLAVVDILAETSEMPDETQLQRVAADLANTIRNTAANELAFQAGWWKHWVAVRDRVTRESHLLLNGQSVPAENAFRLPAGGGVIQYPHDPAAPFHETVNCRCSLRWFKPEGNA